MALFCPVASCFRHIVARLMSFKSNKYFRISPERRALLAAGAVAAALLAASAGAATAQMSIPGKFQVNAAGAATYTIPIAVPPGIAGMAPALMLEYGSQAGNGILGIGWSLGGLPLIVRCPQTMAQNSVRGSINYDGNDRFCIDGQQLVAINGSYGAEATEYRTEIESFSRVISHIKAGTPAGAGPSWFEVHTKSGQVMEFGHTADSQILTPGNPTTRSWAVNKVSDTAGNFYTVTYTTVSGQNYPARIEYAGNSVQFSYATRPDIIWAYQAGVQLQTTQLLSHVKTYAGSAPVADYQLTYQQSGVVPVSRLTAVTLCGSDGMCLPATSFTWASAGTGTFNPQSQTFPDIGSTANSLTIVGDFDGDGKADLVIVNQTLIMTFLSNGNGTYNQNFQTIANIGAPPDFLIVGGDFDGDGKSDFALVGGRGSSIILTFLSNGNGSYRQASTPIGPIGDPPQYLAVGGDFDGDGRSDFALVGGPNIFTYISDGRGGFTGYSFTIGTIFLPPQYLVLSGDFNGDGKSDIAIVGGSSIFTYLSNGNFGTNTGYTSVNTTIGNLGLPPQAQAATGDFNGDGKTDIVITQSNSGGNFIYTFLSNGNGTYSGITTSVGDLGQLQAFSLMTGDFNGDGKTDLAIARSTTLYTFLSNGNGTYVETTQNIPNLLWGSVNVFGMGADFDGDGKTDFVVFGPNTLYTYFGNGGPGNLITSITSGLGATTQITYLPLTNASVYTNEATSGYPTLAVIGPLYVVAQVDASNGIGGLYSTSYGYYGGKSDLNGRGFLGFRQMNTVDQTGIVTRTGFNQNFPFIGTTASEWKGTASQALNSTNNTYQFFNAAGSPSVSSPSITTTTTATAPYRVSLLSSVASSNDLDGTNMPTVNTSYAYDNFNNPTSVSVWTTIGSTPDGYTKTTTNNYFNDTTTNWFLGRLTLAQVTATGPAAPSVQPPPTPPDLTIASSHTGNFSQGQTGATYTITVTNSGAGPTSGEQVSVEDTLPNGLTPTAMSGSGWICQVGVGSPNCTRSDVLAAGASYPAITLTMNVALNAPSPVTNVVTVSGGGEVNTSNDSYSDPTTITTSSGVVRLYLTSGNSWPVPNDWNSSHNTVEVIGGGGSAGGSQAGVGYGTGGGGGGYSKANNIYLTPGANVQYNIGAGGAAPAQGSAGNAGGDTWFNGATFFASSVGAKGGQGGAFGLSGLSGGPGGSAALGRGTTKNSGGIGGTFSSTVGYGAGGGAAGPSGNGGAGGSSNNASLGGGGGGGNGGGAAGSTTTTTTGGAGGNNSGGNGSGAGGASGNPGVAGTNGGGGGGGGYGAAGGNGGDGTEWDASHGSGGGGGANGDGAGSGGSGGLYGGGGGTNTGVGGDVPGAGAQGIIVITYWP
jgi:Salmonella virulence plasmid 65kDa B protein/Insecticide toxin TcdB middle/N-terminal region/FG-GAP-like repeat/Domain of unknown function DUF11